MEETKIDKRTRAYKDSIKNESLTIPTPPDGEPGGGIVIPAGQDVPSQPVIAETGPYAGRVDPRTQADLMPSAKVLSEPSVTGIFPTPPPPDIPNPNEPIQLEAEARHPVLSKRGRKKPNYAKLTKCGEDFSKCMNCGADLPPNDSGATAFRKVPECCDDCVWENA